MAEETGTRPGVLLVTRNFPPLVGGMEKLNQKLLEALAGPWEAALSGPAGAARFAPAGVHVVESPVRPLPVFLVLTMLRSLGLALRRRPAVIVAGSGLTAPIARLCAWLTGARAVAYLHGLDIVAPSRVYQALWLPFIRRCDGLLVNSRSTAGLARDAGIPAVRIGILHPGTDIPAMDPGARARFRARFALGEGPVLLSVGRLTHRKGLAEFIERALPDLVRARPDLVLAIIGEDAVDALHGSRGSEKARILDAAARAGVAERVRFLGRVDEDGLRDAYQSADCHVFPVLDVPGDIEGFGMVALESAANGLPTAGFAVGGVPDAVEQGRSGWLVPAGDYAALAGAIAQAVDAARAPAARDACRGFARTKAWPEFSRALLERLEALRG